MSPLDNKHIAQAPLNLPKNLKKRHLGGFSVCLDIQATEVAQE